MSGAATLLRPNTPACTTGHPVIQNFEPDEGWFYDYRTDEFTEGPELAPPQHRPLDQAVPGPADRVPTNWEDLLH